MGEELDVLGNPYYMIIAAVHTLQVAFVTVSVGSISIYINYSPLLEKTSYCFHESSIFLSTYYCQ